MKKINFPIGAAIASLLSLSFTNAWSDGGVDSTGTVSAASDLIYKSAMPTCLAGQALEADATGKMRCITPKITLTPICATGQVLTNVGGVMSCVTGNSINNFTFNGYKISPVTGLPINHPVISTPTALVKIGISSFEVQGQAYTDGDGMPWTRAWSSLGGWGLWRKSFIASSIASSFEARPAGLTFFSGSATPVSMIVPW